MAEASDPAIGSDLMPIRPIVWIVNHVRLDFKFAKYRHLPPPEMTWRSWRTVLDIVNQFRLFYRTIDFTYRVNAFPETGEVYWGEGKLWNLNFGEGVKGVNGSGE